MTEEVYEIIRGMTKKYLEFNIDGTLHLLSIADSTKIIFPAKRKANLDWDTINKLCGENTDFKKFIERVSKDLKTDEPRHEKYDKLLEPEELKNIIKRR